MHLYCTMRHAGQVTPVSDDNGRILVYPAGAKPMENSNRPGGGQFGNAPLPEPVAGIPVHEMVAPSAPPPPPAYNPYTGQPLDDTLPGQCSAAPQPPQPPHPAYGSGAGRS
eukprot:Rhum_TRINITY_DN14408_c5_g1::Rhum_TRINITY_DN14408_c5_g1_i1::g.88588::m.88588